VLAIWEQLIALLLLNEFHRRPDYAAQLLQVHMVGSRKYREQDPLSGAQRHRLCYFFARNAKNGRSVLRASRGNMGNVSIRCMRLLQMRFQVGWHSHCSTS
jgi:hypothetical protein